MPLLTPEEVQEMRYNLLKTHIERMDQITKEHIQKTHATGQIGNRLILANSMSLPQVKSVVARNKDLFGGPLSELGVEIKEIGRAHV